MMSEENMEIPNPEMVAAQDPTKPRAGSPKGRSLFKDMIDREVKADHIKGGALVGEIVGLACMSILVAFFVAHYVRDTGFFTDEFGPFERSLLFGAAGVALCVTALRIIVRRKNVIRPLDIMSMVVFIIAHSVLLSVFPFDFAYVGDALPGYLSWAVDWISNDLGAIILAIGIIGGTLGAIFIGIIYVNVRKRLMENDSAQG